MSSLYMKRQTQLFFSGGADAPGAWRPLNLLLFKNVIQSLGNYFGPILLTF